MVTAFVLSGRGSQAAQHVGMLQALSGHGITPDLVLGASAGAPNAAYIAGYGTGPRALRRLAAHWAGLGRRDMFPALRGGGPEPAAGAVRLRSAASLYRLLRAELLYVRVEEARIPLHLLARDVRTGSYVLQSNGLAVSAVMASCAAPGLLPVVQRRGRMLCDVGPDLAPAIRHAVELGARRIVVLATWPAGLVTDPPGPPLCGDHPVGVATDPAGVAVVHVVPVAAPRGVTSADFGRAPTLIHAARETTTAWLDAGGLGRSRHPAGHASAAPAASSAALPGARSA